MGISGLQNTQTTLGFLKQRHVLILLAADHLVAIMSNIYMMAALMLISTKITSEDQFAELILLNQLATLVGLPVAGKVGERLGPVRTLIFSIGAFALLPLAFYVGVQGINSLRATSIVSGLIMSFNLPSSSAFTYAVVPRIFLSRFFIFVMATSALDGIAAMASPFLYSLHASVPFVTASVGSLVATGFLMLGAHAHSRLPAAAVPLADEEEQTQPPPPLTFRTMLGNKRFLQLSGARIIFSGGFFLLLFLLPIRIILPKMKESAAGATAIGEFMVLVVGTALVVNVVLNYVYPIKFKTLQTIFLLLAAGSVGLVLAYNHVILLCVLFGLFVPVLMTSSNSVFSSLWEAIDVKSMQSQSVFLGIGLCGSLMVFGLLRVLMNRVELSWIILGYGLVCLGMAVVIWLAQSKPLKPLSTVKMPDAEGVEP